MLLEPNCDIDLQHLLKLLADRADGFHITSIASPQRDAILTFPYTHDGTVDFILLAEALTNAGQDLRVSKPERTV